MATDQQPHPVDRHVGARLRLARQLLHVSQRAVADALGVTFQQMQKYELGSNRISASKLYAAADALGRPVGWFFEGLAPIDTETGAPPNHASNLASVNDFLASRDGAELALRLSRIKPAHRRQILALARALDIDAADDKAEADSA
ncbi:MAG: hypothetical protein B7Z44_19450 [Caulobacter sp. 12-67-6]|nr:MAG: hypothetical protein B7Z44_19450 [Caulobacter sp. 12-67-6]OZA73573.1 MAG: hypothetical protein B7X77_09660 [Caulobacter sp. 39-67-4]HQR89869.1 helix-turn-helix transcriptional regulator [Caulobacter sp.]